LIQNKAPFFRCLIEKAGTDCVQGESGNRVAPRFGQGVGFIQFAALAMIKNDSAIYIEEGLC
jgi:hypothetical protein